MGLKNKVATYATIATIALTSLVGCSPYNVKKDSSEKIREQGTPVFVVEENATNYDEIKNRFGEENVFKVNHIIPGYAVEDSVTNPVNIRRIYGEFKVHDAVVERPDSLNLEKKIITHSDNTNSRTSRTIIHSQSNQNDSSEWYNQKVFNTPWSPTYGQVAIGIGAGLIITYIADQVSKHNDKHHTHKDKQDTPENKYNLPEQPANGGIGGTRIDNGSDIGGVRGGRNDNSNSGSENGGVRE
jgi:hypothetical protein